MQIKTAVVSLTSLLQSAFSSTKKTFPVSNPMVSKQAALKLERYYVLFLKLFICLVPSVAMAEPWDDLADEILDALTNGFTRTLAIIACVGMGIACMIGKMSWKLAGYLVGGIVMIFGSAAIVDWVIGAVE
jgi:type IV secretion system protein VirB2